jgi:hypothetical protein
MPGMFLFESSNRRRAAAASTDDDDEKSEEVSSSSLFIRLDSDVPILSGATPFVITCQESEAYKRWEESLSKAQQEYSTWSSFRRKENVMEYFRRHIGKKVRFLRGIEGARNDLEAFWEVMTEVEVMTASKGVFQLLEKSRRKVESWHGVKEEKIVRNTRDVAFLCNDSRLAFKCRSSKSFARFEEAIRKAISKYKKSWEAFRNSGGVNCYFWRELGNCRMLRARNQNATADKDADWEVLCGEPLTDFMEKQFKHYACFMEDEPEEPVTAVSNPVVTRASAPALDPTPTSLDPPVKGSKKRKVKVKQEQQDSEEEEEEEERRRQIKKRKIKVKKERKVKKKKYSKNVFRLNETMSSDEESSVEEEQSTVETPPPPTPPPTPPPPPSRKLVCSIYLLSKSLALSLGRIDTKIKTKWTLQRLRKEIDGVLRQQNFLTLGIPWEFYFFNSGSFVSEEFEKKMTIHQYLLEANEECTISIRVV